MAVFTYITQAKKNAAFVEKSISAGSLMEAERELAGRNVAVLKIWPKGENARRAMAVVRKQKAPKVSDNEYIAFATNCEQCLKFEMKILSVFTICEEMALTKSFGRVCAQMRGWVSQGDRLDEAMGKTGIFDDFVLGLVRAGDRSGQLPRTFNQIKNTYRRSLAIRKKVKGLMIMPLGVLIVGSFAGFGLMYKVVPMFVGLFASAKMALPVPTLILVEVSRIVTQYPLVIVGGIVGLVLMMLNKDVFYKRFPGLHRWILKVPVVGRIQKLMIQERFCSTLFTLLNAGVPLQSALGLCREVSGCFPYKGAIARAMIAVSNGSGVMVALESEKDIFGVRVIRTLGFGEETSGAQNVLEPLAVSLSEEIVEYVDNLGKVIEPVLTVLVGGVVFLIMLAIFLPILRLPQLIGG
jgi:type IV pilus assembly protein PilC